MLIQKLPAYIQRHSVVSQQPNVEPAPPVTLEKSKENFKL